MERLFHLLELSLIMFGSINELLLSVFHDLGLLHKLFLQLVPLSFYLHDDLTKMIIYLLFLVIFELNDALQTLIKVLLVLGTEANFEVDCLFY